MEKEESERTAVPPWDSNIDYSSSTSLKTINQTQNKINIKQQTWLLQCTYSSTEELKIRRMMMVSSARMRSAQISFIQKASTNSDNGGDGSSNSKRKARNAHEEIVSKYKKDKEDKGKDETSRERNGPKMAVVAVAASVKGREKPVQGLVWAAVGEQCAECCGGCGVVESLEEAGTITRTKTKVTITYFSIALREKREEQGR
ncbi:hypothetical protein Cgig2_024544 [Carnegiea gigantea]|uniref:Uncharacterized protein n=1 Tax=Carnegiea gigantea TaxID=171969 RepID=A0A9Q1Q973_9CARY|nr:hypothetical protein Cgig2_024544 [Carnegiea gigantea]